MTLVWVHKEMKKNISIVIHSFKNTLRLILLNRDLQTRAEVRTVADMSRTFPLYYVCREKPDACLGWDRWKWDGAREPAFKGLDVELSGLFEKLSLKGWVESRLLQSKFAEVERCVKFHQRAWAEKAVWPGVCSFRSNF